MGFAKINIAPTLRYTRWQRDSNFTGIYTRPDQLELLSGFSHTSTNLQRRFGSRVTFGATLGTNLLGDYYSSTSYANVIMINPDGSETTGTTSYVTRPGSRSLIIGPGAEFLIWGGLSLEGAALFQTVHSTNTVAPLSSTDSGGSYSSSQATWRFPVLAKYTLPQSFHTWKPFAEAGPSFRIPKGISHEGITTGFGVSTHLGPIIISPTVRYTRWQSDPTGLKSDEADLLIGVRF